VILLYYCTSSRGLSVRAGTFIFLEGERRRRGRGGEEDEKRTQAKGGEIPGSLPL